MKEWNDISLKTSSGEWKEVAKLMKEQLAGKNVAALAGSHLDRLGIAKTAAKLGITVTDAELQNKEKMEETLAKINVALGNQAGNPTLFSTRNTDKTQVNTEL